MRARAGSEDPTDELLAATDVLVDEAITPRPPMRSTVVRKAAGAPLAREANQKTERVGANQEVEHAPRGREANRKSKRVEANQEVEHAPLAREANRKAEREEANQGVERAPLAREANRGVERAEASRITERALVVAGADRKTERAEASADEGASTPRAEERVPLRLAPRMLSIVATIVGVLAVGAIAFLVARANGIDVRAPSLVADGLTRAIALVRSLR